MVNEPIISEIKSEVTCIQCLTRINNENDRKLWRLDHKSHLGFNISSVDDNTRSKLLTLIRLNPTHKISKYQHSFGVENAYVMKATAEELVYLGTILDKLEVVVQINDLRLKEDN